MSRLLILLIVALPALAHADVWQWRDARGQMHYSNVPANVPKYADPVHGEVGYLSASAMHEPVAVEAEPLSETSQRRAERRLRRRLAEIEQFYGEVRARQRGRLEEHSNVTLLADWMVADRWRSVKEEEARVREALAELERRRGGAL